MRRFGIICIITVVTASHITATAANFVNECENGDHRCHSDATCNGTLENYTCICNQGFTGDGFSCEDINECVNNQHDCDLNAQCINTPGAHDCLCNEGLAGNGRTCIDTIHVTCDPSFILVKVSSHIFLDQNVHLDDLHLNDYSCGGIVDSSTSDIWLFNIPSLSSCSTLLTRNSTHLKYSNEISNKISNGLFIGELVELDFICSFQRYFDGLSLFSIQYEVTKNVTNITAPGGQGEFTATMNHFTDDTLQVPETKEEFEANETLFIEVGLSDDIPNLNLVLDRCWVTPTPDIDHELQYAFIEDGCPVTKGNGDVEITRSGNGSTADFSSQVFSFVDYDTTFLHCSLKICLTIGNESCVPPCLTTRSKRALLRSAKRRRRQAETPDEERDVVSIGPFKVIRDNLDANDDFEKAKGFSFKMLVAILVAVVVVTLASLAFISYLFMSGRRGVQQGSQNSLACSNSETMKG